MGGQDVLTHEFAHTIAETGLYGIYPDFYNELQNTFNEAMSMNLWNSTYSATNSSEYWAVGVTCWFNCAREVIPATGVYNFVNTRDELKEYDPRLYQLIKRFFTSLNVRNGCY
jgi:alpha-glucosidase